MTAVAIQQMADRVDRLLEERLKLTGRDLEAKLSRGGRLLPRKVRDGGRILAEAAETAKNPKLVPQINMGAVTEAYDACVKYLMKVDPAEQRRDTISGMIRSVGFGALVGLLVLVAFLFWRGYF